jgi:hypothetical protein
MLRSVSSGMVRARKFMSGAKSCPDLESTRKVMHKSLSCPSLHTAQIVQPVAVLWAVVPAHVRPARVDDAFLLLAKFAWAAKRLTAGPTLAKAESSYSPRMADGPPGLGVLPGLEFETPPLFLEGSSWQKARGVGVHAEPWRGAGSIGKK